VLCQIMKNANKIVEPTKVQVDEPSSSFPGGQGHVALLLYDCLVVFFDRAMADFNIETVSAQAGRLQSSSSGISKPFPF